VTLAIAPRILSVVSVVLLLSGTLCFGQLAQVERRTTVAPLVNEDILNPCEYRLAIPDSSHSVRAIWTIFERGPDSIRWYQDLEVRQFARESRLALMLAMQCRSKEREDMIVEPAKGIGRALLTAVDQFAETEHRPELKKVRLILLGWSGAASLVGRMAGYRPNRYLAGIEYAPGQYDPLGMDTIDLSGSAIGAPQLIISSGGDKVNGTDRPYAYFKRYFDQGAPWTFAVQNRTPHCCLQNAKPLILAWLRGVLSAKRPSLGTGTFGYIRTVISDVNDEWKKPVFNVTSARLSQSRAEAAPGELAAGWLPSREFAEEWLIFVQRPQPLSIWNP
jgi:hypothetical protein